MQNNWNNFEHYYTQFIGPIYRYIALRVQNRREAEDLTSDVFLKALEHFEDYDHSRPFSNWIYTIAHNHLSNYIKQHKQPTIALEEIEQLPFSSNVAIEYEIQDEMEKIQAILKHLPPEKQQLIEMRYILGYSYKEMGEILGKEENTVKVATFRCLKDLQQRTYIPS
jgi:RNA polymerase sigma-70 factor (ECF subfamily)